jgi:hypothetical protein
MGVVTPIANLLGIDLESMWSGTPVLSFAHPSLAIPKDLQPNELQCRLHHDPLIDTIPCPRFRFNILSAIVTGRIDGQSFSACLRHIPCLSDIAELEKHEGIYVWANPERLDSWEVSETFISTYSFLLEGCEDLLDASSAWRSRRSDIVL